MFDSFIWLKMLEKLIELLPEFAYSDFFCPFFDLPRPLPYGAYEFGKNKASLRGEGSALELT